ncbi:cysteine desulfurase [Salinicoccus cyprini]|uniref:Cysteine desulfurase n=2 Tax=Salinicoccus cyprini TaxID=2493691 RepID=A0A558AZK3_9STAP|nr:cysteine desulfurase [Salinicoccus cyprini]
MIYMDNAATTRPYSEVMKTFMNVNEAYYFNTASIHQSGRKASQLLEASRKQIVELLGVPDYRCIFTSGATEANNLVIQSVLGRKRTYGRTVLVSELEHPSVLGVLEAMKNDGFRIKYIRTLPDGTVDIEHVRRLLDDDVIFITVMAVNNITGSIQPIAEITELLKGYPKAHFHTDATQAIGKIDMDYTGVDSLSFSSHKFHGLKGTGALVAKEPRTLSPILHGGGHENNIRSGTVNLPGAVAMARALRIATEQRDAAAGRIAGFNHKVRMALRDMRAIHLQPSGVPHILNVSFIGAKGEVVVNALGNRGIMVSTTSACASKLKKLNETLLAMDNERAVIEGSIRISFSGLTKEEEVDELITALRAVHEEIGEVLK